MDLLRVVEEFEELLTGNVAPGNIAENRTGHMERISLGKGKWPDDFLDPLKVPSCPIAIRKRSPSSLALSAEARMILGAFAPADLEVSTSVNSSAASLRLLLRPGVASIRCYNRHHSPQRVYRLHLLLPPHADRHTVRVIASTYLYLHPKTPAPCYVASRARTLFVSVLVLALAE